MSDVTTTVTEAAPKGSLAHRLYTGQLSFDFVKHWKRWFTISGTLVLIALLSLAIFRLNLSIDFRGGTAFTIPTQVTTTSIDDYRRAAQGAGLPGMADIQVSTVGVNQVRVETRSLTATELTTMRTTLASKAGVPPEQVANSLIGASWGQQITQQGLLALLVFLVLVSLMIWAYFRDWKMSVAAIVALIHDLILTVGIFAILQFAFSPASLIGMLTILGYSLYDTVVVFDKVRENVQDLDKQNRTYSDAANSAVNQVLVRSINTTIIGVLPVAALLAAGTFILGVGPLKDLGLALFVGMIAGAYSSVFIAAPLLALMREAEPGMKEHRARLARRAARKATKVPATPLATVGGAGSTTERLGAVPVDVVSAAGIARPAASERKQPTRASRAERKK